MAVHAVRSGDHVGGSGECPLGITERIPQAGSFIAVEVVEQHRTPRLERRLRIGDHRESLVVDLDGLQRVFAAVPVLGDHHGDRLTDVVHPIGGQDRQPLFGQHARGGRGELRVRCGQARDGHAAQPEVGCRENANHAGHACCGRGVDPGDRGVRLAGAQKHHVVCARRVIGHELPVSAQQPLILAPPHRTADVARFQWSRFSHCHNAIEMPNEIVINSMMVATMDG